MEVWWAAKQKYKTILTSPAFGQTRIVNGADVMEADSGDYYPRWLENFVDAILDPVPMVGNFRGRGGAVMLGPQMMRSCLRRDDRRDGITDVMTWGEICFGGSKPHLLSVLTTNYSIEFEDWKSFGGKEVARTYKTDVLGYEEVVGRLTKLEELHGLSEETFFIKTPTPADKRIRTAFVSTRKEESLIENAPTIDWPTVHEGKTEGYMIVYARTEGTGQVRETAKHNSDQPGLEDFGMEQALRYKFKPLVVDGVAVQMEMPLVLHFRSKIPEAGDLCIRMRSLRARARARQEPCRATGARGRVRPRGSHLGRTYGCRRSRKHCQGDRCGSKWLEGHPRAVRANTPSGCQLWRKVSTSWTSALEAP